MAQSTASTAGLALISVVVESGSLTPGRPGTCYVDHGGLNLFPEDQGHAPPCPTPSCIFFKIFLIYANTPQPPRLGGLSRGNRSFPVQTVWWLTSSHTQAGITCDG